MIELFASPPSMTYDSRAYFSLFGIGDGDETRNNVVKKVGELGFTFHVQSAFCDSNGQNKRNRRRA
jgi:hypothetical protein